MVEFTIPRFSFTRNETHLEHVSLSEHHWATSKFMFDHVTVGRNIISDIHCLWVHSSHSPVIPESSHAVLRNSPRNSEQVRNPPTKPTWITLVSVLNLKFARKSPYFPMFSHIFSCFPLFFSTSSHIFPSRWARTWSGPWSWSSCKSQRCAPGFLWWFLDAVIFYGVVSRGISIFFCGYFYGYFPISTSLPFQKWEYREYNWLVTWLKEHVKEELVFFFWRSKAASFWSRCSFKTNAVTPAAVVEWENSCGFYSDMICFMEVSINGGTPITGWFISWKIPWQLEWFGGIPILGNLHMFYLSHPTNL